jgi:peroxiredoxin Q/BCP
MVSVDTLEDNTGFAKKEQADFPILADPTKGTATKYGVLNEKSGFANRWIFYIGPDGRIRHIANKVTPAQAGEEVVAQLQALNVPAKK